jgi:hypothetical protein
MKRPIIITSAVVITIVLVVVWLYLLLFGAPESGDEVFANLQFQEQTAPRPDQPAETVANNQEATVDTDSGNVNQLTTRPVAGFVFLDDSNDIAVRYVEKGTGHIYDVNLATGQETRRYSTTVGQTVAAIFAPTGNHVALATSEAGEWRWQQASLGTSTTLRFVALPAGAENVAISEQGDVRYTRTTDSTTGYLREAATGQTGALFTVPLRDLTVLWGDSDTYVYNRPAPYLRGGLYQVDTDRLQAVTNFNFGLTAFLTGNLVLTSWFDTTTNHYRSFALNTTTANETSFATTIIPEKCTGNQPGTSTPQLWCAAPWENDGRIYVRNWYQGVSEGDDALWEVDPISGTSRLAIYFTDTLGYGLDVTNLATNADGTTLGFINRHNDTLWVYYPNR